MLKTQKQGNIYYAKYYGGGEMAAVEKFKNEDLGVK